MGSFNRAVGRVVEINYINGTRPPEDLPEIVMVVEFIYYTGTAFLLDHLKVIPIVPVERRMQLLLK